MSPDMYDDVISALVSLTTPDDVASEFFYKLSAVAQLAREMHQPSSINLLCRMACPIALGSEGELRQLNSHVRIKNWRWMWIDVVDATIWLVLGPPWRKHIVGRREREIVAAR
jgi:hypothetical protein